jgi:hypothetical protein
MEEESLHKRSVAVVTLAVFTFTKPKMLTELIMSSEIYSYKPIKNTSFICMWKINGDVTSILS